MSMTKKILFVVLLTSYYHSLFSQDTLTYRDYKYTIINTNSKKTYNLLDSSISFNTKFELFTKINTIAFRQVSGLQDEKLEKIYVQADKNKDTKLSWSEIEAFQSMLVSKYKYFICDTIVTPDRFLKYGGGKCDDWSLMTAGLLRFWGFEPYIARFGRTKVIGHAICLVYVKGEVPPGYMYYEIEYREDMPKGKYVPIDYNTVGGLNAIDRRWKISHIYVPENLYKEKDNTDDYEYTTE